VRPRTCGREDSRCAATTFRAASVAGNQLGSRLRNPPDGRRPVPFEDQGSGGEDPWIKLPHIIGEAMTPTRRHSILSPKGLEG
jgi:hypothetical protein